MDVGEKVNSKQNQTTLKCNQKVKPTLKCNQKVKQRLTKYTYSAKSKENKRPELI